MSELSLPRMALAIIAATATSLAMFAPLARAETAAPLYWSSPIVVDGTHGFYGLSCPSSSLCVTADNAGNIATSTDPESEESQWTLTHLAGLEGAGVPGGEVSCASAGVCVVLAGAKLFASLDPTGGARAWSAPVDRSGLNGVSCASASLCVAVGEGGTVYSSTDPTGGPGAWTASELDAGQDIDGVSCSAPAFCVAVDEHGDVLTSTDPVGGAGAWTVSRISDERLSRVDCQGVEFCFAAGPAGGKSLFSTDPRAGSATWTATEGIDASGGLSCPALSLCLAGHASSNSGVSESGDPTGGAGSWYSGELGNVGARVVDGVSCPSSSFCLAAAGGEVFLATPAQGLSVAVSGTGSGGVWSPTHLSCPFESCSHQVPGLIEPAAEWGVEIGCSDVEGQEAVALPDDFCSLGFPADSEVLLDATPAKGSVFKGWSGACAGTGECALTLTAPRSVDASFAAKVPIPAISAFRESNASFAAGPLSTPLTGQIALRARRGTTFSFNLSRPATVRLTITTTSPGRRSHGRCQPESPALAGMPLCSRAVTVATITRTAPSGADRLTFSGRIAGKALSPGQYEATLTASDEGGTSSPRTLRFTILTG